MAGPFTDPIRGIRRTSEPLGRVGIRVGAVAPAVRYETERNTRSAA